MKRNIAVEAVTAAFCCISRSERALSKLLNNTRLEQNTQQLDCSWLKPVTNDVESHEITEHRAPITINALPHWKNGKIGVDIVVRAVREQKVLIFLIF